MTLYRLFLIAPLLLFNGLYSLNYDLLVKKIAEPTPAWMEKQIEKDLNAFAERGIYEKDLDKAMLGFTHNHLTLRCKIINGRIFLYNHEKIFPLLINEPPHNYSRLKNVYYVLKLFAKRFNLPDLDLIISLEDGLSHEPPAPVMTFGKNKKSSSLISFPDFEAIRGYSSLIQQVTNAKNNFPFDLKIPKAFWRGATTGGDYTLSNWKEHPRSKLVLFSKKHPHILDAKFTSVVSDPCKAFVEKAIHQHRLLTRRVSVEDHLAFKYLIDIDGNSCTYSRLFWILLSNSLCLKVCSDNEQWYYNALQPYIHYIPLKGDFSDLIEKIQWAENHREEVKNMIQNANDFVLNNLMQEDVFHYIYKLLIAYAKLQRFKPSISTE